MFCLLFSAQKHRTMSAWQYRKLIPVAPTSEINQRIWQVISQIPPGRVATYGDIARQAGLGRGARRVGAALRGLPGDTAIPWHRVINAGGAISLPAGGDGQRRQMARLRAEGVAVSDSGRISLARYRWDPGATEPPRTAAACRAAPPPRRR